MLLAIETQAIPLKTDQYGVIRMGGTRVTLDTVVHAYEQGHTAEEIVSHYLALRLADVYAVIAYYLNNEAAVHDYLQQQEEEAELIWQKIEAHPDQQAFRRRLLARYEAKRKSAQQ